MGRRLRGASWTGARPLTGAPTYVLLVGVALAAGGAGRAAVPLPDASSAQDLPEYVEEALSPYNAPPDSADVAALLERWRADGGLASAHDRVLGARLWRRAGAIGPALDLLGQLPESGPLGPLATLERARLRLELAPDGHVPTRGVRDWRRACGAVADLAGEEAIELAGELWRDLSLLATPEEREAWAALGDNAVCPWLEELVEERAFRMAITADERLALHYRRLATARRSFYQDRPRFYVGMTHWHGRPEDAWLDDRGLVFVRMGRPDETQACGAVYGFDESAVIEADLLSTCWIYDRPGGYRLYYFSTRNKVTGLTSPGGDYYLQENLGPRARPGDPYFHRYVRNADIPRSLKRHLGFGRLASADGFDAGLDRAEDRAYRRQMELATRRFADEALVEIPDAPPVRGVTMLWEALRFLNPVDGTWQVWIVASVPAGQLHAVRGPDSRVYGARARLAARIGDRVELDSAANRAVVAEELPDEAGIPLRTFVVARPGPLPITLVVSDAARPGAGAWARDTVDVPRILPLPTVSDIAVARSEGGTWTRDGETFLRVSPDHVTTPSGEIHVYFEVYGVRRTAEYEVELRLTRDRTPAQAFALDAARVPFRLGFTGRMPYGRIGRHSLRLDLSDTPPGRYDLAVRVVDVDTGTPSLPAVTPIFVSD